MTVRTWFRKLFARKRRPVAARPRTRPGLETLEDRSVPAVLTVNSLLDNVTPDGVLTLREAVQAVNAGSTAGLSVQEQAQVNQTRPFGTNDTIVFARGLSGTITLSGVLAVANKVHIQGPGSDVLSVSGGNAHQVLAINSGVNATISGLTITNGRVTTDGSLNIFGGGAIDNEGNLALRNDVVSNSTATGEFAEGGGIFSNSDCSLSLVNCLVSGNTASATDSAEGGGISSYGPLSLVNCLVSGNTATGIVFTRGGGIGSFGRPLSVSGCTITGNQATCDSGETQGGGLGEFSATASIVNTVFTNNTASTTSGSGSASGGGYFDIGNSITTLTDLTFSGNTVINGGTGWAEGGGFEYLGQDGTFTNVNVIGNTVSAASDTLVVGGGAAFRSPVNWAGGLVSGNTVTCSGSGPALAGGIWAGGQKCTLTGLTVTSNTASNTGTGKAEGGGIDVQRFTALIDCTVVGNNATASSSTAEGGGIVSFGNLTVTAGTIANNRASSSTGDAQGGGIWSNPIAVENGALAVTNATLFGNSVTAPAGTAQGGGLFNLGGATLVNATLLGNTVTGATAQGGGIFNSGSAAAVLSVRIQNVQRQRSGLTSVEVVFSEPVTLQRGAFQLRRGSKSIQLKERVEETNGQTVVTLTFYTNNRDRRALADGRYMLSIDGSRILDAFGQPIPGLAPGHSFQVTLQALPRSDAS
jgi:hypothetical protein